MHFDIDKQEFNIDIYMITFLSGMNNQEKIFTTTIWVRVFLKGILLNKD